MAEHGAGDGQACSHQHGGPDHAMKAGDVLANEVVLHGPTALELAGLFGVGIADAGDICQQRVCPNVADMALIEGQGDAPVEGGTADGQVLQAAPDEGDHFVSAGLGADEVGILLIELEQGLLEFGKLEEPVLLAGCAADGTLAVGADEFALLVLFQVAFRVVGFLVHAVPALIGALIQIALLIQVVPELLDGTLLGGLGGAHETVVGDIEHIPGIREGGDHAVAPFLGLHAVALGGFGNLLAMLVKAGDEGDVVVVHALIAGHGICRDGGVRGAQVRCRVHVVDRCGEGISSL